MLTFDSMPQSMKKNYWGKFYENFEMVQSFQKYSILKIHGKKFSLHTVFSLPLLLLDHSQVKF